MTMVLAEKGFKITTVDNSEERLPESPLGHYFRRSGYIFALRDLKQKI